MRFDVIYWHYSIVCIGTSVVRSVTPEHLLQSFLHLGECFVIFNTIFRKRGQESLQSLDFFMYVGVFYRLFTIVFQNIGVL